MPRRAKAFDALVRAHQGAVRTFLRRLTRNSALADELAQETFLRAFRSDQELEALRDVRAWLLRLAYRQFLDHHRRETRRRDLAPDLGSGPADQDAGATAHPGARLDIAAAMDSLPPERRACALLCLAQEFTHADAARITGLPLGTVKSHVTRAKAALQDHLAAYDGAAP